MLSLPYSMGYRIQRRRVIASRGDNNRTLTPKMSWFCTLPFVFTYRGTTLAAQVQNKNGTSPPLHEKLRGLTLAFTLRGCPDHIKSSALMGRVTNPQVASSHLHWEPVTDIWVDALVICRCVPVISCHNYYGHS